VNTFLSSLAFYKIFTNKDADMEMHKVEIMGLDDTPIQDYKPYAAAFPTRLDHQ